MTANGITVPYSVQLKEFTFWIHENPYGIKAMSWRLQQSKWISKKPALPEIFDQTYSGYQWNGFELT